jgi:hypothetical protein
VAWKKLKLGLMIKAMLTDIKAFTIHLFCLRLFQNANQWHSKNLKMMMKKL